MRSRSEDVQGRAVKEFPSRVPAEKRPFTAPKSVKKAIPPHCFHRSVLRSFSYLVHDLLIASGLLVLALYAIPAIPYAPLGGLALASTGPPRHCCHRGPWVLAHKCGHHAFSDSSTLDDMGPLIATRCMSPSPNPGYFGLSTSTTPRALPPHLLHSHLLLASIPAPSTSPATPTMAPQIAALHPYGPIYSDHERACVFISDVGILGAFLPPLQPASGFSLSQGDLIYGVPLLIVQRVHGPHHIPPSHTSEPSSLDSDRWDWLRRLSAVDRNYGVLNKVLHNITNTHVIHHLFSTIPHYHAMEATKAIKPILGDYYCYDPTPILRALWREVRECVFVEHESTDDNNNANKGVFWYSNKF
ncbi:hypothetical protein J5N97_005458 [Dioscorea zingiberensis]|uniref:Fatty acid desaturase domain-containing protein n=1 Tax=Dioscorea zingiberensis TaxID=325984 RepID=A0A9D5DAS3_9LILI|nr:hypothetical protein J5N97_005458 [Dioscorea zingiberensis]